MAKRSVKEITVKNTLKTIACIGAGNMGSALMKAAAEVCGGEQLVLSDADQKKAKALAKVLGASTLSSNEEAVRGARFVFLAVKPQVLSALLREIAPACKDLAAQGHPPLLVSMVAGASIEAIKNGLGLMNVPVVRIMPNTPALVGRGMIAIAASSDVRAADLSELEKILSGAGRVDRVEEKLMNAVTGLSGSGPAFVCIFIEALADAGVRAGLPRDKALQYAAQTVAGTADMVLQTATHPGVLKDAVCSPGGTTIAGVAALEEKGMRGAVMAAVTAAAKRAAELAP